MRRVHIVYNMFSQDQLSSISTSGSCFHSSCVICTSFLLFFFFSFSANSGSSLAHKFRSAALSRIFFWLSSALSLYPHLCIKEDSQDPSNSGRGIAPVPTLPSLPLRPLPLLLPGMPPPPPSPSTFPPPSTSLLLLLLHLFLLLLLYLPPTSPLPSTCLSYSISFSCS